MTVDALITHLTNLREHGLSGSAIVTAYDGDSQRQEAVTGFLYDNTSIEICTDEQGG